MSKVLLSVVACLFVLNSADAQTYDVSLKYGLTSLENEDDYNFEKHTLQGDFQINSNFFLDPRVDLSYVNVDESAAEGGVSSLFQVALNGVFEFDRYFDIMFNLQPYVYGGLGYEYVTDSRDDFESHPYYQGGTGLRFDINRDLQFITEFKAMQMIDGSDNEDNEFALLLGVSFPIGTNEVISAQPQNTQQVPLDSDSDGVYDDYDACPSTPLGISVDSTGCEVKSVATVQSVVATEENVVYDSDNDGIPDDVDACPNTKEGATVSENGCEIIVETMVPDRDKDGVHDDMDECANTPLGFEVNNVGCATKKTLNVKFDSDSFKLRGISQPKITEFANFLNSHPNVNVLIVGYTDNSGNKVGNKLLSQKRATTVKYALVKAGVKASRISAIGKGDLNPIADNATASGRQQNRRIEAEIIY
jgi:OOP family OmpA-OmpF porin